MKGQAGGIAQGIKARAESLRLYYENPNLCEYCGQIIDVKEGQKISEVKVKRFCSHSCSARFNNPLKAKPKEVIEKRTALEIKVEQRVNRINRYNAFTKGEMFSRSKNWQTARTEIRKHSSLMIESLGKDKKCEKCGYDKHVEICHIKSVSSFPDEAYLKEINSPSNLLYLCPNCHWEFDNL